jgi:hypothetical protein
VGEFAEFGGRFQPNQVGEFNRIGWADSAELRKPANHRHCQSAPAIHHLPDTLAAGLDDLAQIGFIHPLSLQRMLDGLDWIRGFDRMVFPLIGLGERNQLDSGGVDDEHRVALDARHRRRCRNLRCN